MTRFLDTSVIARYLTGDPQPMADRAAEIIESDEPLFITSVILAETAHVLTSVYRAPREAVVDRLIDLIRRENIHLHDLAEETVIAGLLLCRPSSKVTVPDALLWAAARDAGQGVVYTFDQRFHAEGIEVRK